MCNPEECVCNCAYCTNHHINQMREKERHYRSLFITLLGEFDFVKVSNVMDCLNWKWAGSKNPPTLYEMVEFCSDLFARCLKDYLSNEDTKHTSTSTQCGGFELTIRENFVGLKFVVTSWEEPIE